jgi:hypothetical protein
MNEVERWVDRLKKLKEEDQNFMTYRKSGRPCIALMPYIIHWVDELMW